MELDNADEILNVKVIDSNKYSILGKSRDILSTVDQVDKRKVHVYSDSVLRLGKLLNQQKHQRDGTGSSWISRQQFLINFCGIDGEPIEFEWNIFKGLASWEMIRKVQGDLQRRKFDPEKFGDGLFSCPYSTTLFGTRKAIKENVFHIPKKSETVRRDSREDIGRSLDLEVKRSGMVHVYKSPKGSGTPWQHKCYNDSRRQNIQFLQVPMLLVVEF